MKSIITAVGRADAPNDDRDQPTAETALRSLSQTSPEGRMDLPAGNGRRISIRLGIIGTALAARFIHVHVGARANHLPH